MGVIARALVYCGGIGLVGAIFAACVLSIRKR